MEKIRVLLEKDRLTFSYYKKPLSEKKQDLLNTNIISRNELTFSDDYILNNIKLVTTFIKELAIDKSINTIYIADYELTEIVLSIVNNINFINSIYIMDNCNLEYKLANMIIKSNHINYINCYSIPYYLVEELDKYGIKTEVRSEVLYLSKFMNDNNLDSYTKIFYKVRVNIDCPISREDELDFENFIKINKYLKSITFNKFSEHDIEYVVHVLKRNRIKNLKIYIGENIKDSKIIKQLKKLKKKYKKYHYQLHLAYNDEYLKDNIFKQVIINTIKIIGILSISLVLMILGYVLYNNYQSMNNVLDITTNIDNTIKKEDNIVESDIKNNTSNKVNALLNLNPNTVGWIKVNGTNIDYPVLQSTDNDYYLDHNFNDEYDYNGWIFMDYRNTYNLKHRNNIIYGHNRYYSGVMFGTLTKLRAKNFFDTEENNYITFNTLESNYKWKIFSIYKIKTTSDYLKINFNNDQEYIEFLNMLIERSEVNFDTQVQATDKIITLSTCADNYSRFVVHAVLVKE